VLAAAPPSSVVATWWTVGPGGASANATLPLAPVAAGRALWACMLPLPTDTTLSLEYVVVASWASGETLAAPVEGAVSVSVL
jgi:hypothetical protein